MPGLVIPAPWFPIEIVLGQSKNKGKQQMRMCLCCTNRKVKIEETDGGSSRQERIGIAFPDLGGYGHAIELMIKSARKLVVESPMTVGLSSCSAAFHDVS